MRAVVLREGVLAVRDTPDPEPGPGELLLRTLSTAICASDVHLMDHPEVSLDDPTGRSRYDPHRDIVLGDEFERRGAIAAGRLDPLPSVGWVVTLDEVSEAIDLACRSEGPPRIVVHPNGDVT